MVVADKTKTLNDGTVIPLLACGTGMYRFSSQLSSVTTFSIVESSWYPQLQFTMGETQPPKSSKPCKRVSDISRPLGCTRTSRISGMQLISGKEEPERISTFNPIGVRTVMGSMSMILSAHWWRLWICWERIILISVSISFIPWYNTKFTDLIHGPNVSSSYKNRCFLYVRWSAAHAPFDPYRGLAKDEKSSMEEVWSNISESVHSQLKRLNDWPKSGKSSQASIR
jgi:hypothetical protein